MEPAVVLFDEPTSALDPRLVREVAALLRTLDDLKKTLIVVSHDMDFARAISDQVIYFEGGRAVESGHGERSVQPSRPARDARVHGEASTNEDIVMRRLLAGPALRRPRLAARAG